MLNIEIKSKFQKIKLAAFDVDGVMTNGGLIYLQDGSEAKVFNAKDGLGLSMLNKAGIITAIITAKNSPIVQKRAQDLNITKVFLGQKNKKVALDELCKEFNLKYEEILYMGDDLPDLEVLKSTGISACPNDAVDEVKEICNCICAKNGGCGAVREVCDEILKAKNVTFEKLQNPSAQ